MAPKTAFDKKWTSYAMAAGALVAAPMTANADVIINTHDIELFTEDGPEFASLDIDGDGNDDYRFTATSGEVEIPNTAAVDRETFVEGLGSNMIFGYPGYFSGFFAEAFGPGETINGSLVPQGLLLGDKFKVGGLKGEWPNNVNNPRFLGVQFTSSGETYNGWVEVGVQLGSASLNITRSAFNNTPGGPITTPGSVPEPSSMALLLLGAAGVGALKRRRAN